MDDKILLEKFSDGDINALRQLMAKYYDALYVFAVRLLHNGGEAEDVIQDAFMHLWVSRKKLREIVSIRNYMYTIVRNRCTVVLRSSRNLNKYLENARPSDEDILNQQIETETMRLLNEAICSLPARSGEVIKLSLEGMRQETIAQRMNITVATVKALKAEGIRKLRKKLVCHFILL